MMVVRAAINKGRVYVEVIVAVRGRCGLLSLCL